jgi:hypothetical protein
MEGLILAQLLAAFDCSLCYKGLFTNLWQGSDYQLSQVVCLVSANLVKLF